MWYLLCVGGMIFVLPSQTLPCMHALPCWNWSSKNEACLYYCKIIRIHPSVLNNNRPADWHKSHYVPVPYPTVHISVTKWCTVGYSSDALWDLWDPSIEKMRFKWICNLSYIAFKLAICNIQGVGTIAKKYTSKFQQAVPINGDNIPPLSWSLPNSSRNIQ